MHKWKKYVFLTDIVSLYIAIILAVITRGLIHNKVIQTNAEWYSAHLIIFLPSLIFSLLALYIAGLYDIKIIYDKSRTVVLLIYTQITTAMFSILSFYILRTELTPKLTIFFYVIFSIIFISLNRNILHNYIKKIPQKKAFFLTENNRLLDKVNIKYSPLKLECVNNIADLEKLYKDNEINYVIYDEKILNVYNMLFMEKLKQEGLEIFTYNQYYESIHKKVDLENIYFPDLMKEINMHKETRAHFLIRRILDIILALCLYPIYLLSLPFIYVGMQLADNGELYSKQNRVGFLGKIIYLWKIRTMTHTDDGGLLHDISKKSESNKNGNRYTKFGMFLRKTRIDELPQCINLLYGDVSSVGPRALVVGVYNDLKDKISYFPLRLMAPQGLTGWAQVHMNYQPKTFEEELDKFAYDLYYIKYRTLLLDFSIILKTIKTIINREGA